MKKAILACILAIVCLSMSSYAAMECSIQDTAACTGNDKIIFTISNLEDGGSHAVPSILNGAPIVDSFPKSVCCSGIAGLTATASSGEPASFQYNAGYFAGGHFNRTGSSPPFMGGLYLDAPTAISCAYSSADCLGYDTCLFSISADEDAHVSDCTEHPFNTKYCCSSGESTCTITGVYWGVYNEETESLEELTSYDPGLCSDGDCVGPVGNGMDVFLIAETSGCEGTQADFMIYNKDDSSAIPAIENVDMGTFNGEPISGYENVVITSFKADSHSDEGEDQWDYYFKAEVHKAEFSVTSEKSELMKAYDGCGMLFDDLEKYFVCEDPPQPGCCGETLPKDCSEGAGELCDGGFCIDSDCDGVPNCLDAYLATVADPSTVDRCSGVEAGSAGCVPAMDCLNLEWSACKTCEAGQPCETGSSGTINAGDSYMERCEGLDAGSCACKWSTESAPPGCTDAVLNQWNNRFKECIEEEEFPVFDNFNIIAVLLILSMYYGIIIIRKKK